MLGRFNEDLAALQRMIRWGDGDGLHALFTRTRRSAAASSPPARKPLRRISAGIRIWVTMPIWEITAGW